MATSLTSDFFPEFSCTPCSDEDINKEAFVYCVNCMEYFCKECFKFHNRVADASQHHIVNKEHFRHGETPTAPNLPTETCSRHHEQVVNMYCEDHDVIDCSVCVAIEHRSCKDVFYIPDIAGTHLTDESITAVQQNLFELINSLTSLQQDRLVQKSWLESEKNKCLSDVKERRDAIIEYVDKLANGISKDIADKYKEFNDKLENDVRVCNESIQSLETINEKLRVSLDVNKSKSFVDLKRAETLIKDAEGKRVGCKGTRNGLLTIVFEVGSAVKELLAPDTLFGRLNVGYHKAPQSLEATESINVKLKSDRSVCNIFDICQLPNGTIIITDLANENIKSLTYDTTYKVSDSLSMSNQPWGVCSVNEHEVAVTVTHDRQIHIVSVGKKMSITSSFRVHYNCYGIAYSDRRLYIGHMRDSILTAYDLKGNYLHTFSTDPTGATLFEDPYHLCVLTEKHQIVVADGFKGVVIIDTSGHLVTEYGYPKKDWTHGVCTDNVGTMYIVDHASNGIIAIGVDKFFTTLLTEQAHSPLSVLFDKHTKRLFVTSADSDNITIYSIVY